MEQASPLAQAGQLSALADRFTSLRKHLATQAAEPGTGTDGLRRLTPLLATSQDLVTGALARLTVFDESPLARRPGARAAADCLAAVAEDAAHATACLAMAVSDNTYDAAPFHPEQPERDSKHQERHRRARTAITAHLDDAAGRLDNCATACRYTASWLHPAAPTPTATKRAAQSSAQAPQAKSVKLSPVQHQALHLIAQGGVQLRESTRGRMYASVPGGLRINMATYTALHTKGLVHRDTSTSLYAGQALTSTERGKTALAARPAPIAGREPAGNAVPKVTAAQGVRR